VVGLNLLGSNVVRLDMLGLNVVGLDIFYITLDAIWVLDRINDRMIISCIGY